MKILNLYAGLGGNRKLWEDCSVTAIEHNSDIAAIYQDFYPNDVVIVEDAHEYLMDHFNEFNFIWSSPPCQSHSSMRQNICVRYRGTKPIYPDLKLYEEILFLKNNFDGKWVVENVNPYYDPLIDPTFKLQRHLFWSNFSVLPKEFSSEKLRSSQIPQLQELYGINLDKYKIKDKRQLLRNCIYPPLGLYILEQSLRP